MAKKGLIAALAIMVSIASVGQGKDEKVLMLISNTHLDTQWNWDAKTTIDQYVKNTLYDNIALMDKYPAFMLNYESAIKYRWMKEYYPSEYAKLQTYIDRGQWNPSGMSVDANDVMVSSAENILRNWLYGHMFFKREFGVRGGYDIMLPDCFGFGYSLPSLAHHAGFKGFHSQKLSWGCAEYDKLPRFGRWQGVDGSIIYAIHKPGAYDAHEDFNNDLTNNQNILNRINENQKNLGIPMDVRYVGPRSDRGGALQDNASKEGENTPYWLNLSAQKKDGKVNVILATPDSIFRYLDSHGGQSLPIWTGELPMKQHGVGSYTSKGALKRWNRKNELTADAAEKASSTALWLGARAYPYEALTDAWFRTLWQNHHDGITGTSIHKADEISYNEYFLANKTFAQELTTSIGAVVRLMDTNVEGTPIVVYNPLSWERTDIVEGRIACSEKPEGIAVYGPDGEEVLAQITDCKDGWLQFIFAATVPSLGYAVYDLRTDRSCSLSSSLTSDATSRRLSNGHYRVDVSATGDITSLYDMDKNRSLMSTAKTQFLQDEELVWEAWEISYDDVVRTPKATLGGTPDIQLVENGPLRKSFRVLRQKDGSTFLQHIRMSALSNRIDCVNEVDWQTTQRLLKVQFPFSFSNASDTYDLSLGTIERGIRSTSKWEVIGHQWADHSTTTGTYGVSVLTDCKYGWDKPSDKLLRLTLQHTPYARDHKHHADMDLGANHYTYSLFPHEGRWGASTQREASQLNQPLVGVVAQKHAGALGRTIAFAEPNTDEVSIKALKKAEETDELIVRVFEWVGTDKEEVRLHFPATIVSARETNALEETLTSEESSALRIDGQDLVFPIGHYQPKTFALRLAKPEVQAEAVHDTPVNLAYGVDMMSYDSSIGNGLSTYTYLYPAEQIPDELEADGIRFVMGDRTNGKNNAMRCSGQTIELPQRTAQQNKLYLLLASCNEAGTDVKLSVGDSVYTLFVPYFTGLAGQPLTTINLASHYTQENIALTATHAHNASSKKNEPLRCMYLYKFCINLPAEATSFSLSGTKTMLYAATLSDNCMDDIKPLTKLTTEIGYDGLQVPSAADGRLKPSSVKASHQNGTNESGAKANDMDVRTKWCVTASQSQTPWLEYTFREDVVIDRWLVLHAASETEEYVTKSFKLQYQDEQSVWIDAEQVNDNQTNKTFRPLGTPITTRKVRLQIVQGAQSDYVTRIYEFAVYGHLASETPVVFPTDEGENDAPATFYTLDGIGHATPQRGINIVRRGSKTTKILR